MIRLRGNTHYTQKAGWQPADITVEITVEREGDYEENAIAGYTERIHDELVEACQYMNGETSTATLTNRSTTSKEF